jgi:AcrR family transcriptional regulator
VTPAVAAVTDNDTDTDTEAAPARRGRPRDERVSSAITAAARRQLEQHGYANVSMDSVASEAGVARATIYRRYRDKADLITAAIADNSTLHLSTEVSSDPRSDLAAYLAQFDQRFAEGCLEVVGTLIGMREEPSALDLHRERVVVPRMEYIKTLLLRAQEVGELRRDADLDLALQMVTGSVFARRVAGQSSEDGWADRAVDTIWAGMGPG